MKKYHKDLLEIKNILSHIEELLIARQQNAMYNNGINDTSENVSEKSNNTKPKLNTSPAKADIIEEKFSLFW